MTESKPAKMQVADYAPLFNRPLLDRVQKALQGEEKWALLYLMDWPASECNQPPKVFGDRAVFPDVHGFYDTEAEAIAAKQSKIDGGPGYFVRRMRNYSGSGV